MSLLQVIDDVNRCKEVYACRLAKLVQNRLKYETVSRKGFTSLPFYSVFFSTFLTMRLHLM